MSEVLEHSRPPSRWAPYDQAAVVEKIAARLAQGETLVSICKDKGMPDRVRVYEWAENDPKLALQVSRARAAGYDKLAEECLDIAEGSIDEHGRKSETKRDKLRIETRLKLLAKWDPKRYGEAMQLRHADADGEKLDTQPMVRELLGLMAPGAAPAAPTPIEGTARVVRAREEAPADSRRPDPIDDLV